MINQNNEPSTGRNGSEISSINNGYDANQRQSIDSKPPSYQTIFPKKNRFHFFSKLIHNRVHSNSQSQSNTHTSNSIVNTLPPMSYAEFVQSSAPTNTLSNNNNDLPEVRRQKKLIERLKSLFQHSYYLRHFVLVSAASFCIISIQVILITNNALYSNFYCGIWAGILNLFLILLSINTCITLLSIFSLVQYSNCIASTNGIQFTQLGNICTDLLKYGNLFMILVDLFLIILLLRFSSKLCLAVRSI